MAVLDPDRCLILALFVVEILIGGPLEQSGVLQTIFFYFCIFSCFTFGHLQFLDSIAKGTRGGTGGEYSFFRKNL
jgi:hypothetical protein